MSEQEIFEAIKRHLLEIVPEMEASRIVPEASMQELGANSVDRAEVILLTMSSLKLKFPLIELGGAKNLRGLAEILHKKKAQA